MNRACPPAAQCLRLAGVVAGRRREHVRAFVEVRDVPAAADDGLVALAEDRAEQAVAEARRPREAHARREVQPVGRRRLLGARKHGVLHTVQLARREERRRRAVDVRVVRKRHGAGVVVRRRVHFVPQAVVQRELPIHAPHVLHKQAGELCGRPVLAEDRRRVLQRGRIDDAAGAHFRHAAGEQRIQRLRRRQSALAAPGIVVVVKAFVTGSPVAMPRL